jgi:(4S)-4-hydroxy-5-phosphonooxypentane-2,3-dione isomerase
MVINHVHIHVKLENVEAFKQATLANALESRREPGIAQFDCLQLQDDPTRFVLVEAYRQADSQAQHRQTRHYEIWRDTVAPMMAEPRTSEKFVPIEPDEPSG